MDGKVIHTCMQRHRHQEWIKFLKLIDKQTPSRKQLHLVVDNYATHKHPKVKAWLKRHTRFHMHFTPTSSSWLNMVERFSVVANSRIALLCSRFVSFREQIDKSVNDLIQAVKVLAADCQLTRLDQALCLCLVIHPLPLIHQGIEHFLEKGGQSSQHCIFEGYQHANVLRHSDANLFSVCRARVTFATPGSPGPQLS